MGLFTDKNMRLLLLQILMLLAASQDFVPLVLGPDFQRAYDDKDILRGFKLNVAEGENPLKGHAFEGGINSSPFSTSYTKSAVIKSVEDVKEMMEIKGSLSVSYGPMISGSGAGSYLQSKVKSKRQISILYRTRRVAYAKKVDVKTLVPVAGLDKLEPDEITELYGSKFIDQILYGAQLDVIFTVESTEDTDFFEIEAELKGKIGFGPLSVSFQANFQKQEGYSQSRYDMEIEARASGIAFGVPSNPSFDQINELIDNFNAKYEEMLDEVGAGETVDVSNVANQFSPVAFALSPIAEYLPSKLSVEESARLDDKMEALRDVFYHALFVKSQLNKIRNEQELLYGNDPRVSVSIFQPYDDVVNDVIGELENKIDECLDYRKKPLREILTTSAKVPNKYASTVAEVNVLKGLIGEAYLPSPVTISGMTFEEFHYIGFALPSDSADIPPRSSSLVPWMGGVLRLDDDDSIVASAYSPDTLAEMGLAEISSGTGHKYLRYGDQIFLQVSSLDYRWLKRDNSTGNAMSRDYFSEISQSVDADYQWHVRSKVGDLGASDPKQGQCVKYGDMVFLNANGAWLHRKPYGECEVAVHLDDGSCVNTVDKGFQTARLQWKVRSTIGSGSLKAESNPDPAHGQCIQLLSKIYLQSNNEENLWLTGGRSNGQSSVWSLNFYTNGGLSGDYEQIGAFSDENKCMDTQPDNSYLYMLDCDDSPTQLFKYDAQTRQIKHDGLCLDYYTRSDDGSGWTNLVYMYPGDCHESNNQKWLYDRNTMELKSLWDDKCVDMASDGQLYMQECHDGANQKFVLSYEQAHHKSYEWIVRKEVGDGLRDDGFFCPADTAKGKWKPIQTTFEIGIKRTIQFPYWEKTTSWEDSVTASVTSGFQFGGNGIDIPWIDAKEMETSVRSVLRDPAIVSDEDTISGQAWQFVYDISDACAPMWELKTNDLVVTKGVDQEPCCLPGQELDAAQPHGPCKFKVACQCEDYVCYPSTAPTSTPTAAPTSAKETSTQTAAPTLSAEEFARASSTKDSNASDEPSTAYWVWIVVIVAIIAVGVEDITDTANSA